MEAREEIAAAGGSDSRHGVRVHCPEDGIFEDRQEDGASSNSPTLSHT